MKNIKIVVASLLLGLFSLSVFAAPINVNSADAESLAENIVGVGPKIAERIVVYRSENGPFANIADLMSVKGIGEKTIEKNKDVLLLNTSSN